MAKVTGPTLNLLDALQWGAVLCTAQSASKITGSVLDNALQAEEYQIQRLRRLGYVERKSAGQEWVYVLTEKAVKEAGLDFNPEKLWKRPWDGQWTFLMFDIDAKNWTSRSRLHRWLASEKMGRLQGSVWITPDSIPDIRKRMHAFEMDAGSFFLFRGKDEFGLIDEPVIYRAWNFDLIEEAYQAYDKLLSESAPKKHQDGSGRGSKLWRSILRKDPFLPAKLLPKTYPGTGVWKRRQSALGHKSIYPI